jgi:hypothetical protein
LELLAELYEQNLSDAIAMKEWLKRKLDELGSSEPDEDGPRSTNHYLCLKDLTRWDAAWSCMCNDRCPTCDAVVEPYQTTSNADQGKTIHNQEVYDRANA